MTAPEKAHRAPYASAEAAALAMPPMTADEVAIVARILATVEKRRTQERNNVATEPVTRAANAEQAA